MSVVFMRGTDVIHLPSPEFGDSETLGMNVGSGVAMDGGFYTYVRTPVRKTHNMSFSDLTRAKVEELVDFLIANQGEEVTFVDLLSVSWKGFITTDPNEITADGRGRGTSELKEGSSIDLVFEGEQL